MSIAARIELVLDLIIEIGKMIFWIAGLVLIIVVLITMCSSPQPPQVDWSDIDAADRAVAEQAWQALLEACPRLTRYAGDITGVEVTLVKESEWVPTYLAETYDWPASLTFIVAVSDDATRIPNSVRAWGHNLYYNVGGGSQPGIDSSKPQARYVCDGQNVADRSSNWFKPAPGMKVVDRL